MSSSKFDGVASDNSEKEWKKALEAFTYPEEARRRRMKPEWGEEPSKPAF